MAEVGLQEVINDFLAGEISEKRQLMEGPESQTLLSPEAEQVLRDAAAAKQDGQVAQYLSRCADFLAHVGRMGSRRCSMPQRTCRRRLPNCSGCPASMVARAWRGRSFRRSAAGADRSR